MMMKSKPAVEARLLGRGDVIGVGIGLADAANDAGALAYRIYKSAPGARAVPMVEVPVTIEGHPTVTIVLDGRGVSRTPSLQTRRQDNHAYDPLVGGIKIGDGMSSATLGVVVRRDIGPTGPQYMLSCHHFMNVAMAPIVQPAGGDGICAMAVAGLYGNLPVRREDGTHIVFVDAAVAEIFSTQRAATDLRIADVGDLGGWMTIDDYLLGHVAFKRGSETLLTAGRIADIAATLVDPDNYFIFRNVMIVEGDDFSGAGDSGAIVYVRVRADEQVKLGVVGLLCGQAKRDPRHYAVVPVDALVEHLNVVFVPDGVTTQLSGEIMDEDDRG